MGYISRDIAKITEPRQVSLASQPNFFIIEALGGKEKQLLAIDITVNIAPDNPVPSSLLTISDYKGNRLYSLTGTADPDKAGGSVYYISSEKSETAENIRNAFLSENWLASMFEISVPVHFEADNPVAENHILLNSKDAGTGYNLQIDAADPQAFTITQSPKNGSQKNDSICGEEGVIGIELDVYEATGIPLGSDDRPLNTTKMGRYFLSLQKSYAGQPLWFELNALLSKKTAYNLPPDNDDAGWFNTGTLKDYRFVAKIKGKSTHPFYYSNVLHVLNGYGYPLDPIDLTPYIFDNTRPIRLLTNKPDSFYVKGQKEYLNFIFSDPNRGVGLGAAEYTFGVGCNLTNAQGQCSFLLLGEAKTAARAALQPVNSCAVNLTSLLNEHPGTVSIELFLTRNNVAVSNALRFSVLPECLHRLCPFTFLNKLGGWDTFNADADITVESKQTSTTYNKALLPGAKRGDSLETTYAKEVKQTYSFETPPLDAATRIWLQELIASPVILDPNGNYIIVEEAKLSLSGEKESFSMKYRLTQPYNG